VNNCVGWRNHKFYMLYLYYNELLCGVGFVLGCMRLYLTGFLVSILLLAAMAANLDVA